MTWNFSVFNLKTLWNLVPGRLKKNLFLCFTREWMKSESIYWPFIVCPSVSLFVCPFVYGILNIGLFCKKKTAPTVKPEKYNLVWGNTDIFPNFQIFFSQSTCAQTPLGAPVQPPMSPQFWVHRSTPHVVTVLSAPFNPPCRHSFGCIVQPPMSPQFWMHRSNPHVATVTRLFGCSTMKTLLLRSSYEILQFFFYSL